MASEVVKKAAAKLVHMSIEKPVTARPESISAEEKKEKPRAEITITLKGGSTKIGTAWESTPLTIAREISKSLSERIIISKVNNIVWDLDRPFEVDSSV
ncbi:hypothetical protein V1505DRAFT_410746 [Lipomyces doorenjongii]